MKKNCWWKENWRNGNSEMKSKSADLEFNKSNDRDNNRNVNLMTI